MNLNTKVKIPESLLIQVVDDEIILLDTNTQEYFTLSEVGKVIFEELKSTNSLNDTYNKLIDLYDVDEEILKNDLFNFIKSLLDKKLIILD